MHGPLRIKCGDNLVSNSNFKDTIVHIKFHVKSYNDFIRGNGKFLISLEIKKGDPLLTSS